MRFSVPFQHHINTTVSGVDAGVYCPYRCIDIGTAHKTPNTVFTFMKQYLLTVMKFILYDGKIPVDLFRIRSLFLHPKGGIPVRKSLGHIL